MQIIININKMHNTIKALKFKGKKIGLVPTMGDLHEGHFSLIRQARKDNSIVVVSIFVNPAQFGPNEDYKKYPRNLEDDRKKCRKERVDYIFYPDVKDIYPEDYLTFVEVTELSKHLCGKYRPVHFRGVTTIVLRLFNIIIPDTAYFGLKDYQQYIIIKKMVENLNICIIIYGIPLVREKNGLALSSRNRQLNKDQRNDALLLSGSLFHARDMIEKGIKDCKKIKEEIYKILLKGKFIRKKNIDYVSVVHPDNLNELKTIKKHCVIALAVRIGTARLIDNIII